MKVSRTAGLAALLIVVPAVAFSQESGSVDLSKPLSADDCVRLALTRNYSVLLSRDRLSQTNAGRTAAYGAFFPSLSAGWTYSHTASQTTQQPPSPFQPGELFKSDSRGYNVSASQTLLSVTSLLDIASARKASGAARADVATAEQAAALAVREQYYSVIEASKLLEVNGEDLKLANEELKRTQSLFDVGSVARTDVLKAEVRVAQAQSAYIAAQNGLALQKAQLSEALALPAQSDIQVEENLDPRTDLPDSAQAYSLARDGRPDLKAAWMRVDQAGTDRKAAFAAKIPTLSHSFGRRFSRTPGDVITGFDVESGHTITQGGRTTNSSWNYQIGFNWNILDRLVTVSNIQRTTAEELSARHSAEQLDLSVQVDVTNAWILIRNAREQLVAARQALASSEEDMKLSRERYGVGLGTILELIDAEVNLTRARSTEVSAMVALKKAEAAMDRAIGRVTW